MKTSTPELRAPDLTQRPPRSLRVRLGGYTILPRLLDKCRASVAGTVGEYDFNCPLDRQFFDFTGIDAAKLQAEVAQGKGDVEMLEWVRSNTPIQRSPWEIEQWSRYQEARAPELHSDSFAYFTSTAASASRQRGDIRSWADLLDLDDYCAYGGAA